MIKMDQYVERVYILFITFRKRGHIVIVFILSIFFINIVRLIDALIKRTFNIFVGQKE